MYYVRDAESGETLTANIPVDSPFVLLMPERNLTLTLGISQGCFMSGTKVWTSVGPRNIEDVQTGDYIYTYNDVLGTPELDEVLVATRRSTFKMTYVRISDGTVLYCTPGHKFRTLSNPWVEASKLEVGETIFNINNERLRIIGVETSEIEETEVYNLTMKENHNYYVGDGGVLVHNRS